MLIIITMFYMEEFLKKVIFKIFTMGSIIRTLFGSYQIYISYYIHKLQYVTVVLNTDGANKFKCSEY